MTPLFTNHISLESVKRNSVKSPEDYFLHLSTQRLKNICHLIDDPNLTAEAINFISKPYSISVLPLFRNFKYCFADNEFKSFFEFIEQYQNNTDEYELSCLLLPTFAHIAINILCGEGHISSQLFVRRNKGVFIKTTEYDNILSFLGNIKHIFQVFNDHDVYHLWKNSIVLKTSKKTYADLMLFLDKINSKVVRIILAYLVTFKIDGEEKQQTEYIPDAEKSEAILLGNENSDSESISLDTYNNLLPRKFICCDITKDNTEIAFVTDNNIVAVCELRKGENKFILAKPDKLFPVYCAKYSSFDQLLLVCTLSSVMKVRTPSMRIKATFSHTHDGIIWDLDSCSSNNIIGIASEDTTASIFSFEHGLLSILKGHFASVNCIKFSSRGEYVATGSSDFLVRLWWSISGVCVRTFNQHKAAVDILAFTPDDRHLSSADAEGKILTWNLKENCLSSKKTLHRNRNQRVGRILSLCYDKLNTILAASCSKGTVKIWNLDGPDFLKYNAEKIMLVPSIGIVKKFQKSRLMLTHITNNNEILTWNQSIFSKIPGRGITKCKLSVPSVLTNLKIKSEILHREAIRKNLIAPNINLFKPKRK